MRIIQRNIFLAALGAAGVVGLTACGSNTGSSSNGGGSVTSTATLSLTAPSAYPAGSASPINAILTLNNNSNESQVGLQYSIPNELNTTGVTISVSNSGDGNQCKTIAAHSSCTFPVTIAPNAHAGSFAVAVASGTVESKFKSLFGLQSASTTLTANVGITNVTPNTNVGADGITFLYNPVTTQNPDGSTSVTVVAVVGQNAGGLFDTINLTDANGDPLNFEAISGNSGAQYTNLNAGDVVTLVLKVPAGQSSFNFYAQAQVDGANQSQGTTANSGNLVPVGTGILSLSPLSANFSATESTITLMYTNTGTANVTGLTVGSATAPINISSNTCSTSLAPNSSCQVVLNSAAAIGTSGNGSFSTSYTGGSTPLVMNYNYAGLNPESGFSLAAGNNFNFAANTGNTSESTQVTLTNTANVDETGFDLSFNPNSYFTVSAGTGSSACSVEGNKITSVLQPAGSCNFTLTYTNATIASGSSEMAINYLYHDKVGTDSHTLNYNTVQVKANLSFTPLTHDFGTIVALNRESNTFDYTLTNAGPDVATNVTPVIAAGLSADPVPVPGGTPFTISANTCASTLAANATCTVSVKFGPTSTVAANESATLRVNYNSETNPSQAETSSATATGTARAPLSANPRITAYSLSIAPSGGDGAPSSKFAIAKGTANEKVTLTYSNSGAADADGFTIATTNPTGYTYDSGTCANFTLQKANGNSCTMTYLMNTSAVGDNNLSTPASAASWSTIDGGETTSYSFPDIIYVNIYTPASVAASLTDTSGTTITSVTPSQAFRVKFTLSGGYNVPNTTYTVIPPAGFIVGAANKCNVNSNTTSCTVTVVAPATPSTGNVIALSGSPAPTPASLMIDVQAPPKVIFVSQTKVTGNLGGNTTPNGAAAAADAICNADAARPDKTAIYKALIITSTRGYDDDIGGGYINWPLKASSKYVNKMNQTLFQTDDSGSPAGTEIAYEHISNKISSSADTAWTGAYLTTEAAADYTVFADTATINATNNQYNRCNNWTSQGAGVSASYGDMNSIYYVSDPVNFAWWGHFQKVTGVEGRALCNTQRSLICVQQ